MMIKKVIPILIVFSFLNLWAGTNNDEFDNTYVVCSNVQIYYRFYNKIQHDLYTDTNDVVYIMKFSNVNVENIW